MTRPCEHPRFLRLRAVVATCGLGLLPGLAACSDTDPAAGSADPGPVTAEEDTEGEPGSLNCLEVPRSCSLAQVADEAGFLVGAAVDSTWVRDPAYADVLAAEFNSVTAEREMKWDAVQPQRGTFDFTGADEIVDFAEQNGLVVKGHALVWDQEHLDSTPDWVLAVDDPDELRAVLREHFTAVLGHFGDSVDRWDVVNEPIETLGVGLYPNHFQQVLGDRYIDEVFALAREVSPTTSLWINEAAVEFNPAKAEAFHELVAGMVERGVPLDGVGLQGHLLAGAPQDGFLEDLMGRFAALGLEVGITEMDLPVEAGTEAEYERQADVYAQVVDECLAAGCSELTTWGVHDPQTWLDDFMGRTDTDPLLFDGSFTAKPAHAAVKEAIASGTL